MRLRLGRRLRLCLARWCRLRRRSRCRRRGRCGGSRWRCRRGVRLGQGQVGRWRRARRRLERLLGLVGLNDVDGNGLRCRSLETAHVGRQEDQGRGDDMREHRCRDAPTYEWPPFHAASLHPRLTGACARRSPPGFDHHDLGGRRSRVPHPAQHSKPQSALNPISAQRRNWSCGLRRPRARRFRPSRHRTK